MAFTLKKTSNQKMSGGKKFIFKPRILKILNQRQKKFGLEKANFWCTLIQEIKVKMLVFFTKCSSYNKIFASLQAEIQEGGPHQPLSYDKRPSLLNDNTARAPRIIFDRAALYA